VNIKIAGKWMFIPLKMVLIGIDPYPYGHPGVEYTVDVSKISLTWECFQKSRFHLFQDNH
jgi:hypothetical protein